MNWFWILVILFCLGKAIEDFSDGGWEGYWRKTRERNRMIFGGGFKVGRFFLRSYLRHHR